MKKNIFTCYLLLSALFAFADGKNVTVVISIDGCRWDYPQWYDTPFFDYMGSMGVASGLIPSFPSKTFPNHYTLATGLYPDHHGIVANSFYDSETGERFRLSDPTMKCNPKYYGGEPIWVTAQKNGLRTAVFYWPGSDVKVCGQYPWHFHYYDETPRLSAQERVDGIIGMLEMKDSERPRLIMAYFEQPDHNGHRYGPQSKHTRRAVEQVDSLLQVLYERIKALSIGHQVNFIVLSDHGMTEMATNRLIDLRKILKREWYKAIEGNVPANVYAQEGCTDSICHRLEQVDHIKFWKKEDVPAYLHYGSNDRIGEIVVLPDIGWECDSYLAEWGSHGFDPEFNDMHALFRAVGPDFVQTVRPHFSNIHIYPLLCRLLNISPAPNDGSVEAISDILKK